VRIKNQRWNWGKDDLLLKFLFVGFDSIRELVNTLRVWAIVLDCLFTIGVWSALKPLGIILDYLFGLRIDEKSRRIDK